MPFDNAALPSRPYMRLGTGELASLVDVGSADLASIAAELAHRDRKPARLLAERIAALMVPAMEVALVEAPPPVVLPPAEVVECIHGALVVREEVISIERVEAVEPVALRTTTVPPTKAPPAAPKPARKGKPAAVVAVDPGYLAATSEFGRAYAEAVAACRAADSSLGHWFRETVIVRCGKVDRGFGMSPRVNNGRTTWVRTIRQRRVPAARYWPEAYRGKVEVAAI